MLTIEIVSDVVCPWCFIGIRRLAAAVALIRKELPDFQYRAVWRPFFLNPDTPPEGEPYLPFLLSKFGSQEKGEGIFSRVRAAGEPYGITYAFEKIALRANTLNAHRLLHRAQTLNPDPAKVDALVERLFAPRLDATVAEAWTKDPKTELQEWLQARREPLPQYRIDATRGRQHDQTFIVVCEIASRGVEVRGEGRSRRAAEQAAASAALDTLRTP